MLFRVLVLGAALASPVLAAPTAGGAWVRVNPVPGRPSAGYLTITGGAAPDTLIAVTAPGLRIEMHSMTMDAGVMKMARLDSVAVPAGGKAVFAPGDNHLMIFGLAATSKPLTLTLGFGSGARVTTSAEIRAAGAAEPPAAHAAH